MNKYDLEKNKALKLAGQLRQAGTPGRFGAGQAPDRREQRKLDQAAQERGVSTNDIVAELLQKALDA